MLTTRDPCRRLGFQKNQFKFKALGKSPIILEESQKYTSNQERKPKISTYDRLDLETHGPRLILLKISPETRLGLLIVSLHLMM